MPLDQERLQAKKTHLAKLVLWFVPLLWTVNMVVARTAPGVMDPHLLALGRWSLAGLILAYIARTELWLHRDYLWQHKWRYIALGACGMWICGAWVYLAGRTTVAMNISLIYASAPVMIALGAALWLGEAFSKRQGLGVVLAMAGGVAPAGSDKVWLTGWRQGQAWRQEVDLASLVSAVGTDADPLMAHGDLVWVDRQPQIYIYGEVQRPGQVRLERSMTLMQALASGGGLTPRGTERGIRVHRRPTQGPVQVLQPALDDLLQPGDVVYVRESLF
ncbi:MAG: hypothetical protein EBW49_11135 [Betaproteobacteria bacterium]|nr:hypothetical protein [Betaproteobacteria bacterium]